MPAWLHGFRVPSVWVAGASKKWPGCTRFAVYLAFLSAVLALAELAVGAAIMNKLLGFGKTEVPCYRMKPGPVTDGYTHQRPPFTVIDILGEDLNSTPVGTGALPNFSLSARGRLFPIVLYSVMSPFFTLFFSTSLAYDHVSKQGISIRRATLYCLSILFDWTMQGFDFGTMSVDYDHAHMEFDKCWVEHDVAVKMWGEKTVRTGLGIARLVVVYGGFAAAGIYLLLAARAWGLARDEHTHSQALNQGHAQISAQAQTQPQPDQPRAFELTNLPAAPRRAQLDNNRGLLVDAGFIRTVSAPSPDERSSEGRSVSSDEESDIGMVGRSEAVVVDDFDITENPFADPVNPFEEEEREREQRGPFEIGDDEEEPGWDVREVREESLV